MKNKKNFPLYMLIGAVLVIAVGIIYLFIILPKTQTNNQTITKDNFTLTYQYNQNNQWTYTLQGNLPTPCYKVTVESLVLESYPEQVHINVTIQNQEDGTICSQVIQEVKETGTFQASEKATVTLNIQNS